MSVCRPAGFRRSCKSTAHRPWANTCRAATSTGQPQTRATPASQSSDSGRIVNANGARPSAAGGPSAVPASEVGAASAASADRSSTDGDTSSAAAARPRTCSATSSSGRSTVDTATSPEPATVLGLRAARRAGLPDHQPSVGPDRGPRAGRCGSDLLLLPGACLVRRGHPGREGLPEQLRGLLFGCNQFRQHKMQVLKAAVIPRSVRDLRCAYWASPNQRLASIGAVTAVLATLVFLAGVILNRG